MEHTDEMAVAFVREASLGLPGSIKDVADFLLNEGSGIEHLTMGQVAANVHTSKPTLVRFAKMAGYDGWKDFRHDFLAVMKRVEEKRAEQMAVDVNYPFGEEDSTDDVVASVLRIHELAVSDVSRTLDKAALAQATSLILAAHNVAFFGATHNRQRGKVFASRLGVSGTLCHVPDESNSAMVANHLQRGDCAIVVSYSGGLGHVPMALVPQMKQRGVSIVDITGYKSSGLGMIADCALFFPPLEHYHDKIAAFYSGACTSLILDLLYAACFAHRYDECRRSRALVLEELRDYVPQDFSGQ